MSENSSSGSSTSAGPQAASGQNAAPKVAPKQNPAFKMMGMPNLRFKLPSRNWLIFWTITGSFVTALIYDRREKRRAQQKWSDLVSHISKETISNDQMRRKLTIFLSVPPGDGLRTAREHFIEYVKPVLVSASLDYEVVEGRREGEVRAGLADKIRKLRREAGERSQDPVEETPDVVVEQRNKMGIAEEAGPKGDLVIGRHTWKEYIRGLHEGWLGPLEAPAPPLAEESAFEEPPSPPSTPPSDDASPASELQEVHSSEAQSEERKTETEENKVKKATGPKPAYIPTSAYPSQPLPPSMPQAFEPSAPIEFPHLLGFLNTPIRIYRYLNQRYVADSVGREVAAVVLAASRRPYNIESSTSDSLSSDEPTPIADSDVPGTAAPKYEQQVVLVEEEKDWHKSVHKKAEGEPEKEREWLDGIVLDPRLANRMNRFTLSPPEEERAGRLARGEEVVDKPEEKPMWKHVWEEYGWGETENDRKRAELEELLRKSGEE